MIIRIEGMICEHCRKKVEDSLNAIDGVKAIVDLDRHLAEVKLSKQVPSEVLRKAVEGVGYTVKSVEMQL